MKRKKFLIEVEVILDPNDEVVNICETIADAIPWHNTEVLGWDWTYLGEEDSNVSEGT